MAAIERKPLTAYQRRLRKELGGDEDDQPTVDQQLARLEVDIRRLKVEFDIFFNGGVKHPPYETRNRVETTFARLGDDRTLTYAQRYKYNSLASRFASFRDMWRRSMQSKEEGRDFITVARAKLTAMREAADAEIAARNAAKYGTKETTETEPPPAAGLVEKSTPELAAPADAERSVTTVQTGPVVAAPVVREVAPAVPPPSLELVPPVHIETENKPVYESSANVIAETRNDYQTDGFGSEPGPTAVEIVPHEFESVAVNVDALPADEQVAELTPADEIISRSSDEQLPVDDFDRSMKPMPARFPKILPPSAHASEPQSPVKYTRRAGDRRSADRRALPFGRRATDYTPDELKPTTEAPIIAPTDQVPELPRVVEAEPVFKAKEQSTTPVEVASSSGVETPAPQSHDRFTASPTSTVPDAEVGSFEFTNPRREPEQVKALVAALVKAKEACGESSADLLPTRYGHLLAARADKLKKKSGCTQVIFTIVIEDGQVSLNARAGD